MAVATPEVWSKTPSSNGTADSQIGMAEGMLPGDVNDGVRALMAGIANLLDDQGGQKTTGGTTTAYTMTANQTVAAYADGLRVHVVFNAASTGAFTFNLNGIGAKNVYKMTSSGTAACAAGDVQTDFHGILEYDASLNGGAGGWMLLNPIPASATTPAPITASYVTLAGDSTLTAERILSVASSLSLTDAGAGNTVTIGTAAHTGDVTSSANSMALTIATGAVTAAKIGTNAVTTAKIADGNVTVAKLADSGATVGQALRSGGGSGYLADGSEIVAFRATKGGTAQSGIASNTLTQLTWSTEDFDLGGFFASNGWTPPAGLVEITVVARYSAGMVDQELASVAILKDGVAIAFGSIGVSGTGLGPAPIVTVIDQANGSNVYTASFQATGAGSKSVTGTVSQTYFCGHVI